MIKHPIKRHDGRVKLAHQVLSDVIDAVFVVSFIHLRDVLLGGFDIWQDLHVVVLPYIV